MEIKISHHKNSVDLIIKYTAGSLPASNFLCVEYVEEMHSKSQATEITHLLFSWKTELSVPRRPLSQKKWPFRAVNKINGCLEQSLLFFFCCFSNHKICFILVFDEGLH